MSSTMFKVVLGALAAQTSAQEMMLGQPAVQMSAVSSFSGADGIMHTSVHKVITETSNDGSLKRVEMDCQDGDCSKSVSKLFTGSSLFQQLPKMPESIQLMPMHHGMPMMMGCMHKMREHMHKMQDNMHHVVLRLHNAMPQMGHNSGHFLAPRFIIVSDVPPQGPPMDGPVGGTQASPNFDEAVQWSHMWLAGLPVALVAALIIQRTYRCCFQAKPARELQELGAPLAPEEQAELGAGAAGAFQPRVQVAATVEKMENPTEAYLLKLYQRAAHKNEKQVAQTVLRDVYAKALQRLQ